MLDKHERNPETLTGLLCGRVLPLLGRRGGGRSHSRSGRARSLLVLVRLWAWLALWTFRARCRDSRDGLLADAVLSWSLAVGLGTSVLGGGNGLEKQVVTYMGSGVSRACSSTMYIDLLPSLSDYSALVSSSSSSMF